MNIHIHHFHSKGAVADQAALEQFQTQWATYQKLVDADALAHKEVRTILHSALATLATPFAFVDIACGDAGQMAARCPAPTRLLSRHRLVGTRARSRREESAGVSFEVELDHRDFVTALTRRPEPADAAWCALSVHHLSTEGKRDLLDGASVVRTSAFLMIYGPTRLDGETDDYLVRFRRVNRPAWPFLSDEEWAQIDHHVTTCDYPETSATWVALGREAGFADAREIFCDPTGFYRIYRYEC